MKETTVSLSSGVYHLRRPTLGGWERLLTIMSEQDYDVLFDAIMAIVHAPEPEEETDEARRRSLALSAEVALRAAGAKLLTLAHKAPKLIAQAICECCVNTTDGKRGISLTAALELDDQDVAAFINALRDSGLVPEMVDRLKNVLARKAKPQEAAST